MPKLLLKFNAAVIKEIPITKNEVTIGRKAENDVVIDNPAVSGTHAKIMLVGDTFFVEDNNSTNGTFVNEKKIVSRAGLKNNDVIGIVKHALVFLDERAAAAAPAAPSAPAAEATMVMSPQRTAEVAAAAAAAAQRKPALVRVIKGVVDAPEYELKDPSTYIGKSDRVRIKIKGSGLFGKAPENAAMIAAREDGYYLVPIEEGYTKVNGNVVVQKQLLKEGDLIELGGTTLRFSNPQ